ncbi:RNA polymerase sigma factor [Abyssalbus ytuae]|uniref:RNA polymerase sigma factor n=1 Tax=Abyssalbus ytuae TaxID=2926907 RepID=A0A9E7D2Z4_9FLAO|nr:RNA polymerase sigma factor [Abyssalbus ytuae]UOB17244.1 RNA polymerase sigma factor [Abyssalbus ytuae]
MEANILYTHKEFVEKSKLGDKNSQFRLYELYVDAMYNTCYRLVKTKEDTEDIIQDSFVDAFKNLQSFRYESTFGSWLKKIVINKSINHLKQKRILSLPLNEYEYGIAEEAPETNDMGEINIQKIKKGISMLPVGYNEIITLYLVEGFDHIEISEVLGISVSTSKSQYHRAKKKLIEIISKL